MNKLLKSRLWYGFWLLWAVWTLELHVSDATRRVIELPHNHLTGTIVATVDIATIVFSWIVLCGVARQLARRRM